MPRQPFITLGQILGTGEGRQLLNPGAHAHGAARERHSLVTTRVRTLALLLCALTLAWTVVDFVTFDWPVWGALAGGRLVAAAAFLALACHPRWRRGRLGIAPVMSLLIGVILAFYLWAETVLQLFGVTGLGATSSTAYNDLPYITAAGLAIFPLTMLESGLAALAIVVTTALSMTLWPQVLEGEAMVIALWHVVVTAGIAGIAGMCQLRLLITLTDQANRDGLTRAFSRQGGAELLAARFARAQQLDQPLTLAFIDLDQFKDVNDRYGHEAGDQVLQGAARRIRENVRESDTLIRWGGEEFLLILPETTIHDALPVIERLAAAGLGPRPNGVPQTACVGLAERISDNTQDWHDLVAMADLRMYAAKRAGRNRYTFSPGNPLPFIRQTLSEVA
ncbi:MAG: GGDEF domain-containing protein [Azospirillaceae bacterium]|nr:GGDEF domain-containing protein [Azospirillaceae bacterium]